MRNKSNNKVLEFFLVSFIFFCIVSLTGFLLEIITINEIARILIMGFITGVFLPTINSFGFRDYLMNLNIKTILTIVILLILALIFFVIILLNKKPKIELAKIYGQRFF